jgi:hypothetical protein
MILPSAHEMLLASEELNHGGPTHAIGPQSV